MPLLQNKNAFGAVKNYLDNSIGKKNLKRIIIDNYESEYLTDESIINAVKELSEEEEYEEVARWVSIFGKKGELLDIVRKKIEKHPSSSCRRPARTLFMNKIISHLTTKLNG